MKKSIAALLGAVLLLCCSSCNTVSVDFSYFDSNFSPFYARGYQDLSAMALTQETLIVTSSDEDAQIITDAYSQGLGVADVDFEYGDASTVCTVKLGQDVFFSDGVQLTSKDVAFSMYVYAQSDYDGWSYLNSSALAGLEQYQYGTDAVNDVVITDEQVESELENPCARTRELISSRIIYPVLREEYNWVTHLYTDDSYVGTDVENHIKQHPDPRALFAFYYSIDTSYDALSAADRAAVIDDIAAQYGWDYKTLSSVYGSDLSDMAKACAGQALKEQALENMQPGQTVSSISGIEIIDDFMLRITVDSLSQRELKSVLGIYVAPFHYYGSDCSFDGSGFTIDSASVQAKSAKPLGAGRYVFKSYEAGGGIKLSPNKNYYRTFETTPSLYLKETGNTTYELNSEYMVTTEDMLCVRK